MSMMMIPQKATAIRSDSFEYLGQLTRRCNSIISRSANGCYLPIGQSLESTSGSCSITHALLCPPCTLDGGAARVRALLSNYFPMCVLYSAGRSRSDFLLLTNSAFSSSRHSVSAAVSAAQPDSDPRSTARRRRRSPTDPPISSAAVRGGNNKE